MLNPVNIYALMFAPIYDWASRLKFFSLAVSFFEMYLHLSI